MSLNIRVITLRKAPLITPKNAVKSPTYQHPTPHTNKRIWEIWGILSTVKSHPSCNAHARQVKNTPGDLNKVVHTVAFPIIKGLIKATSHPQSQPHSHISIIRLEPNPRPILKVRPTAAFPSSKTDPQSLPILKGDTQVTSPSSNTKPYHLSHPLKKKFLAMPHTKKMATLFLAEVIETNTPHRYPR
jgi:hypothetical protein